MIEIIGFYTFAIATIACFVLVVRTNQPLYALTALAGGMIFISGFFFMLDADFLGATQILAYTGAIVALYAFAMMFFDSSKEITENQRPKTAIFIIGTILALTIIAVLTFDMLIDLSSANPPIANVGNTENIGYILFTKYLVPFELAAIMLLVAMIAGITLAKKRLAKGAK